MVRRGKGLGSGASGPGDVVRRICTDGRGEQCRSRNGCRELCMGWTDNALARLMRLGRCLRCRGMGWCCSGRGRRGAALRRHNEGITASHFTVGLLGLPKKNPQRIGIGCARHAGIEIKGFTVSIHAGPVAPFLRAATPNNAPASLWTNTNAASRPEPDERHLKSKLQLQAPRGESFLP